MADSATYFHESYLINIFKIMRYGGYNEKILSQKRNEILRINQICQDLFSKDYILQLIDNASEVLCPHYPPKIIIPYKKLLTDIQSESSVITQNSILMQDINKSINARCRNRFAVPALSFKNKQFLCRSSTLSSTFEIYGRQYFNSVFGGSQETGGGSKSTGKEAFDQLRGDDKQLLETLRVKYIFDLMLENKKMMFGLPMSSSEKVDRHQRYKDFSILSLPYPGCEFFNDWRQAGYTMTGLRFDWDKVEINSRLQLQLDFQPAMTNQIHWLDYQSWDLTELTGNYLKLILGIMVEDEFSVLIHCISGWDRTPLFTSLVRCMMWADGLAHQSLSVSEMLYLTLAYDWYLFGHQTKMRLECGEEILKFTFAYLHQAAADLSSSINYVYGDFTSAFHDAARAANNRDSSPKSNKDIMKRKIHERTEKLVQLVSLFDSLYNQELSAIVNKSSKKGSKSLIYSASNLVNGFFYNSPDSKFPKNPN